MLIVWLIAVTLLSLAALGLALARSRAAGRVREDLRRGLSELREEVDETRRLIVQGMSRLQTQAEEWHALVDERYVDAEERSTQIEAAQENLQRNFSSLHEVVAREIDAAQEREFERENERANEREKERRREEEREREKSLEAAEGESRPSDDSGSGSDPASVGDSNSTGDYASGGSVGTGCAYLDSMIASAHEGRETGGWPSHWLNEEDSSASGESDADGASSESTEEAADASTLVRGAEEFFNATMHPRELLTNDTFLRSVEVARTSTDSTFALLASAAGYDALAACMSLEAVARRKGEDQLVIDSVLRDINGYYYWPRFFALRALGAHAGGMVLARLLARLNASWRDDMPMQFLREFIAERTYVGEGVTTDEMMSEVRELGLTAEQLTDINQTLRELGDLLPEALKDEAERWLDVREASEFVKTFGRVWEPNARGGAAGNEVFVLDSIAARVAELEAAIKREPARSVLLVGESGTGKTALVRALAERLRAEQWIVFEAGAGEVMAGQTYIGQMEERVQSIVRQIGGKRVLWVVPNFHETLWAGRHRYSPVGVLDLLLPSIESGAVKVIGEVPSEAYEQLLRLRPEASHGDADVPRRAALGRGDFRARAAMGRAVRRHKARA
jgi:uncharacterized protein YdbL (DUF1318 family)